MAAAAQARQIQKVYSEWCVKAAEIILASRIDDPGTAESHLQAAASFNLRVPELFNVRSEAVARPDFFQQKTQRSFQVEIYLGEPEASSEEAGQLLERWTFTFFPAQPEPAVPDRCNQVLVRKLGVTLRSLLCFTRILPAHTLCRAAQRPRRHRFRIEAWPPPRADPAQELLAQDFASLQSSLGTLRLSLAQRKDLKSMLPTSRFHGAPAVGSQLDPIEVEESYFATTVESPRAPDTAASLGRLGKIAEEPEARGSRPRPAQSDAHHNEGADQQSLSSTPSSQVHEATATASRNDRVARPRVGSEDSITSTGTISTSSRAPTVPDHAVVLGATPPLASLGTSPPAGLITLGPHYRGDSACSSRSHTPQTTPKLGPVAEPPATPGAEQRCRGSSPGSGRGPALLQGSVTLSAAGLSDGRGSPPPASPVLGPLAPSEPGQAGLGSPAMPPCRPGEMDDLSGIWMTCPPEWGARRRSLSIGTGSRGSGAYSRSLSPEDTRNPPAAGSRGAPGEAPRQAGVGTAGPRGTGVSGAEAEPEGEICMFGMSDDDDEDPASDDEDELERNVVASTIQEGGGAAFATATIDPERLGLAGFDPFDQPGHRPAAGSELSSSSPLLSPLIAQLNPFTPPPPLDLPAPALPRGAPASGLGQELSWEPDQPGALAAPPEPPGAGGPEAGTGRPEVQQMLDEMGDLVCKLQQRQELAITAQEVSPAELLERLAHFRDVANSGELLCSS